MPGTNLTREEARERARILSVDGYQVSLDLGAAEDLEQPTYRSVSTVRFRCAEPGAATFLDLLAPSVARVTLNGTELDPAEVFDGTRVQLPDLATDNEVTVVADCAYSNTGEGMHRFADPEDGEVYLYTQYEPADARRVFANFEQPDLKASHDVTVTAPARWTVLSNGAEQHDDQYTATSTGGATAASTRTRTFARTQPISTYITAVVAGPYHQVHDTYHRNLPDGSTLTIPLSALCRKGLAPYLEADDILTVTRQGLDFFHDQFAYPYPFGKYDQVFVPEYNLGAMENPGCVTFTEDLLFRSKATESDYQARATVILHEMAHMWFGDLVTMQWWDDLWLKESFADFMGSFALVEATRFTDGWVAFANGRKSWAYRQDQLPTTHPITADIHDLQDAKLNFDGITYAKGASVLKQLVAYVGQEEFLEGSRHYFQRHAWGNTQLSDLLTVLEETSGRDLRAWSEAWLQTSGVNALTPRVEHAADGSIASLTVLQEAADTPPTLRPHRIAVGLYRKQADGRLVRTHRVELDVHGTTTEVPQAVGHHADLVLLNDDDLSYAKVRFDETSLTTLREHLGDLTETMPRALAWSAMWNMTRDGLLPARDYLTLVLRFAGDETDVSVLQSLHGQARTALEKYTTPDAVADRQLQLADGALSELRTAEPGSGHQLCWARFLAHIAHTPEQLRLVTGLLDGTARIDGLTVDTELRWELLESLVTAGQAGVDEVEAEARRDATASGQRHRARLLAARPDSDAKADAWHRVVDTDELPNAMIDEVLDGFRRPSQRELLEPYVRPYFAALERIWTQRSISIAMRIVRRLYPDLLIRQDILDRTDAWLADASDIPALRRLVVEARDDLARALRARQRDAAA